jgi:hypothetical protein
MALRSEAIALSLSWPETRLTGDQSKCRSGAPIHGRTLPERPNV